MLAREANKKILVTFVITRLSGLVLECVTSASEDIDEIINALKAEIKPVYTSIFEGLNKKNSNC